MNYPICNLDIPKILLSLKKTIPLGWSSQCACVLTLNVCEVMQ